MAKETLLTRLRARPQLQLAEERTTTYPVLLTQLVGCEVVTDEDGAVVLKLETTKMERAGGFGNRESKPYTMLVVPADCRADLAKALGGGAPTGGKKSS